MIDGTVFSGGADDGLDHNDAFVEVRNGWFENFVHEGLAGSVGRELWVVDTVVTGCGQGIV